MAGASAKIKSLIAQEFSFVQELVWLPPRRNPFSQCTDKIVSDLRRLEVLFRRPAHVPLRVVAGRNNFASSWRAAEHALAILSSDVALLIKVRHSLCKQLNSVQTFPSLKDFENQAEVLIMQHLENAWGSCKHGSVELWASKVKGLDFQALDTALQQRFESFFGCAIDHVRAEDVQIIQCGVVNVCYDYLVCRQFWFFKGNEHLLEFLQCKEHGDDRCNSRGQGRSCKETQNLSDAISLVNNEEYDDDAVSEVDSDGGGPSIHNQRLPLVLISSNESGHDSKTNVSRAKNRRNLPAQIELTMKARICTDHITAPEENCWHIIFGLVNHDHCEVAVHSLSYWSLDNESEVSTIKWPKGGVVLKETPSFVCYSCQVRCMGSADSPRVAFSWQYRSTQKYPAALRGGSNETVLIKSLRICLTGLRKINNCWTQKNSFFQERALGSRSLELQETGVVQRKDSENDSRCTDLASLDVLASCQTTPSQVSSQPFYKRLGNLLPWKDSHKKTKVSTT